MQCAGGVAQGIDVFRQGVAFEAAAGLKERIVEFKGVGRDAEQAIHAVVGGAIGGIQLHGGLWVVLVEPGHASAQRAQLSAIGRQRGGVAPGPQHEIRIAVHVEEDAAGVIRRGTAIVIAAGRIDRSAAAVGEYAATAFTCKIAGARHIAHQVVGFRLGLAQRTAKGFAARVAAGTHAIGDVPVKRKIAVEVDAYAVAAAAGTVDVVGVLAPG